MANKYAEADGQFEAQQNAISTSTLPPSVGNSTNSSSILDTIGAAVSGSTMWNGTAESNSSSLSANVSDPTDEMVDLEIPRSPGLRILEAVANIFGFQWFHSFGREHGIHLTPEQLRFLLLSSIISIIIASSIAQLWRVFLKMLWLMIKTVWRWCLPNNAVPQPQGQPQDDLPPPPAPPMDDIPFIDLDPPFPPMDEWEAEEQERQEEHQRFRAALAGPALVDERPRRLNALEQIGQDPQEDNDYIVMRPLQEGPAPVLQRPREAHDRQLDRMDVFGRVDLDLEEGAAHYEHPRNWGDDDFGALDDEDMELEALMVEPEEAEPVRHGMANPHADYENLLAVNAHWDQFFRRHREDDELLNGILNEEEENRLMEIAAGL